MIVIKHTQPGYARAVAALDRHAEPDPHVAGTVSEILQAVRRKGDAALLELTVKFGGPKLRVSELFVAPEDFDAAVRATSPAVKRALRAAHKNVAAFAKRSLRKSWTGRNAQGARVGERFDPFPRVGIYVPGGTAPLVSTAIMTVTLAKVAGVPEIAVATPPGPGGAIHPALLFALQLAGATEVIRVGGAQAIAALAYGTRSIRPVTKIFGPGNAYVVEAKRQVFGRVAIDLLPGPSEVVVVADAAANPAWIAADLLAQAEHGTGSVAALFTPSARVLAATGREVRRQARSLSRGDHLAPVLESGLFLVETKSLDEAIGLANAFAPEHLSLFTRDCEKDAARIRTAGAIFLGQHTPVAAGDFVAGPSHELPTGGAGKSFAGLTVDQFQRRTSLVRMDAASIRKTAPLVAALAGAEGLDAHARSARIRTE